MLITDYSNNNAVGTSKAASLLDIKRFFGSDFITA
jgi:hypothetical protein